MGKEEAETKATETGTEHSFRESGTNGKKDTFEEGWDEGKGLL